MQKGLTSGWQRHRSVACQKKVMVAYACSVALPVVNAVFVVSGLKLDVQV